MANSWDSDQPNSTFVLKARQSQRPRSEAKTFVPIPLLRPKCPPYAHMPGNTLYTIAYGHHPCFREKQRRGRADDFGLPSAENPATLTPNNEGFMEAAQEHVMLTRKRTQ